MAQIQFYHLTATPVERALPKLLEKALAGGHRVLLVESAPEKLDYFNQILWTYSTLTFLPHGAANEPQPEEQPILLAPSINNTNNADALFVTDGTALEGNASFSRVIDIFDGNNAEAVARARSRWATYKNAGHTLSYLRQNESGGWEEKQAA